MPDAAHGQSRELLLRQLEALRERSSELEELHRGIAQHGRDIVTLADAEGSILQASPNLYRVLGHAPESRRGGSLFDLLHPDEREAVRQRFLGTAPARTSYGRVGRVRHADGSWRWLEASGRFFRTASGELRCLIVSRDVTDRWRRERLRERETELLKQLVAGAARDEALEHVVRIGEEAAPETSCSILLLEGDGRRLRPVAAAGLPARHLHGVDEISTGPGSSPCVLAARRGERVWIEDVEADPRCAGPFRERAHALGLRACWSEPILVDDRHAAGTFALYGRHPGLPSPLERTFLETGLRLARLVLAREAAEAAPALGLADPCRPVFERVLEHGRRIFAALPEGHPARAEARHVVQAAQEALGVAEAAAPIPPYTLPEPAASHRVLVVDDEEAVRSLIFEVLRRAGYEAVTAADGQEALERYQQDGGRFDLVVLDWRMPRLGGEPTFQWLRALRPDLPILFVSGHLRRLTLPVAGEGPTALLQKPFEPAELVARVQELLRR
jgi:PAS domain S-box-containing protein